ncbi:hypothetical protein ACHAXT_003033 [Thalassiosira profunda]
MIVISRLSVHVLTLALLVLALHLRSAASFSVKHHPPFRSFEFDKVTGVCRRPAAFQYTDEDGEKQLFVMRNTPGDGDCVFHAVLSSVFISMGMMNPDSAFNSMMSAMVLEMRSVVANFLSSPEGILYVDNKPNKKRRIVRCRDLLQSAAQSEGLSADDYLAKLRQPGKMGGLYGGGPELTVLSNVLRRPISIYHIIKQQTDAEIDKVCEIERMGVFGEGLFEDPGESIPNSVVSNAVFFTVDGSPRDESSEDLSSRVSTPYQCKWDLHVLVTDASEEEKHATVLLPSVPILHELSSQ